MFGILKPLWGSGWKYGTFNKTVTTVGKRKVKGYTTKQGKKVKSYMRKQRKSIVKGLISIVYKPKRQTNGRNYSKKKR